MKVAAEHVNGVGEVSGTAYCCIKQGPLRWSPAGVPTVLRGWYSERDGYYRTAALNDSGAVVLQQTDIFSSASWLITRDGSNRVLNVAPMGGCSATDLAETALVSGTCYIGWDPVTWVPAPAVYDGFSAPRELPLPSGAASPNCTTKFISAWGSRVVGECSLASGKLGVMWSGPDWAIAKTWSTSAFQARDVDDSGDMLGKSGTTGQWARWASGTLTPLDWPGKAANQQLLDGVRYDASGAINIIVSTTASQGISWQAGRLVP